MIDVRVVGVGSPLGDDRLGWRVIELLQSNERVQNNLENKIDIQQMDRPGLTLVTLMQDVKILYIIDAMKTGQYAVGDIQKLDAELLGMNNGFFSSHGFGVVHAIALAKTLKRLPQETTIYGIEIGEVNYRVGLSSPIESACQNLAKQITEELLAMYA